MLECIKVGDHSFHKVLYVFAIDAEAAGEFDGYNILFAGIGKLNAAYSLTKKILLNPPDLIVNLGTAGSNTHNCGEVVYCDRFVQRDMDATGLGFEKYQTPLSDTNPILEYGLSFEGIQGAICGSGDSFETNHASDDYDVFDMEAYALAWIAKQENIPFLCLKYISDSGDEAAGSDWNEQVHKAASALKRVLQWKIMKQ